MTKSTVFVKGFSKNMENMGLCLWMIPKWLPVQPQWWLLLTWWTSQIHCMAEPGSNRWPWKWQGWVGTGAGLPTAWPRSKRLSGRGRSSVHVSWWLSPRKKPVTQKRKHLIPCVMRPLCLVTSRSQYAPAMCGRALCLPHNYSVLPLSVVRWYQKRIFAWS